MAVTQYTGARYVPVFADPIEWDSQYAYEPLTIVLHEGNSYTARQYVPKGVDIANDKFWAETGNYNAQVEQYRQETRNLQNDTDTLVSYNKIMQGLFVTPEQYGAKRDGVTDDSAAINSAIASGLPVMLSKGTYVVESPIVISKYTKLIGTGHSSSVIKATKNIPIIKIAPEHDYSIAGEGFIMDGFKLNGSNVASHGVYYDNLGKTENYIARFRLSDIEFTNCTIGLEFTNEIVLDGYFVGIIDRCFSGCPFIFNRAGDSLCVQNSQFYENGYFEVKSIAAGAREFSFINNNFTADHFYFNGTLLRFVGNQMEPRGLPGIKITGYSNIIDGCTVYSHSTADDSYLIELNNGDKDNAGLKNIISNSSLVHPKSSTSKILRANDMVVTPGTQYFSHTGRNYKRNEINSYIDGLYIDGKNIDITPAIAGATIVRNNSYYENGMCHFIFMLNLPGTTLTNAVQLTTTVPLKSCEVPASSWNAAHQQVAAFAQVLSQQLYARVPANVPIDNVTTMIINCEVPCLIS